MRIRSVLKHSTMAVLEGALVASLVVGLMAGTALAGKPSGGGSGGGRHNSPSGGTLAVQMVTDADGDGAITAGDTVTYDISRVTSANPYITTTCTQGGTMVLSTWAGYYDGYMWPAARNIKLASDLWTTGAATCTGVLYGTSTKLSFSVGG